MQDGWTHGRVGSQVDLEPKGLTGQELLSLAAVRAEQARPGYLGLTRTPLAQPGAALGRVEVVGEQAPVPGNRLVGGPVVIDLLAL